LARPIVVIPYLFRLADAIKFSNDYSPPSSRHFDPTPRPQTQQLPSPLHPLLINIWPTGSLLLDICQRKILILSGILHSQMIPATLLGMPLLDKNLYNDLVVKSLVLLRAHMMRSLD